MGVIERKSPATERASEKESCPSFLLGLIACSVFKMAHPHPLVNFHSLPEAPDVQSLRSLPDVGFPECSSHQPLDLNFSQKLSQNPSKGRTESELEPSYQLKESETSPSSQQEIYCKIGADYATSNGVSDGGQSKTFCDSVPSKTPQRSRCHWTHGEVIALFDAKKAQAERFENGGKKVKSASEKWDEIAEFCRSLGSKKNSSQCKDKWERLWPAFRKILDWERSGKGSYWTMLGDDREREGFPRVFDRELYDAMSSRFSFVRSLNLSSIVVDSSNEDSVEAATNACNEPLQTDEPVQTGIALFEDGPSVVDDLAPISSGRKRKNTARLTGGKQPPAEASKRILLCLESNEENGDARSSKDFHVKSKSADFTERRLLLEERKVRLEEQRFLLEEKKVEAAIEIGNGLIASIERMTKTISSLGVFSPPIN